MRSLSGIAVMLIMSSCLGYGVSVAKNAPNARLDQTSHATDKCYVLLVGTFYILYPGILEIRQKAAKFLGVHCS